VDPPASACSDNTQVYLPNERLINRPITPERRDIVGACYQFKSLTDRPGRGTIQDVRGLLRFVVVGFTVVSLLLVGAVGVSASSSKSRSAEQVRHSVVALFSGHLDETALHEGTGSTNNGDGSQHGNRDHECKPSKKHHHHATNDHENNECGGDDSGAE
jgi:hypothetical protein